MRKHHTRWVALFSAAAISTTGLVGLAGPASAAADDKDTKALSWPVVRQGVSTYSIDGYEIAYLPAGLERYGINASSTTDRQGNSQSQLSWVQGPDQLYGRVAVLRSERLQDLDDLREGRYSHLAESSLEELEADETFEHGAYLSEETGDLFWLERPGVAVVAHLQPDRWEGGELLKFAEAVTAEAVETEAAAEETAPEADAEGPEVSAPTETEGTEAEETTAEADAGEAEAGTGAEEAEESDPAEAPQTPQAPEGPQAPQAPEAPETPEGPQAPAVPADEAAGEEGTEGVVEEVVDEAVEAPVDLIEEVPVEEAPVEEETTDEAPVDGAPVGEAPVDEEVVDSEEVDEITPVESVEEVDETTPVEDVEEVVPPVEADLPENVSSREVKTCLTEHFVDFGSGQTDLDPSQMTKTSGTFVEKALTQDDLDDAERDRLLATVWYYGNENDKVAATNDCARQFGIERSEVEDVLAEVADLIGQIVQEANESVSQTMDEVKKATGEAGEITDPVDAEEWAELWESLPWSLPEETS